jgi:hypothetical protein
MKRKKGEICCPDTSTNRKEREEKKIDLKSGKKKKIKTEVTKKRPVAIKNGRERLTKKVEVKIETSTTNLGKLRRKRKATRENRYVERKSN